MANRMFSVRVEPDTRVYMSTLTRLVNSDPEWGQSNKYQCSHTCRREGAPGGAKYMSNIHLSSNHIQVNSPDRISLRPLVMDSDLDRSVLGAGGILHPRDVSCGIARGRYRLRHVRESRSRQLPPISCSSQHQHGSHPDAHTYPGIAWDPDRLITYRV